MAASSVEESPGLCAGAFRAPSRLPCREQAIGKEESG